MRRFLAALLLMALLIPAAAQADVYESTMILVNKQNSLPSDYVPSDLSRPEVKYAPGVAESRKQMREPAARALEAMFAGALNDGIELMAISGYRSYWTQRDIYETRLHPYTEGLFNSLPDLDSEQEELKVIHGLMPDPTNLPSGCCFHPRCPYATEECSKCAPAMTEVSPGHFVACPVRTAKLNK